MQIVSLRHNSAVNINTNEADSTNQKASWEIIDHLWPYIVRGNVIFSSVAKTQCWNFWLASYSYGQISVNSHEHI